ncbi:MAG: hypothetical protein WB663_08410 [Beijerinckiaceae bacterium]
MRSGQQGGSAAIAGASFGLVGRLRLSFGDPRALFRDALEREIAERRPFLWLPAAAGAGVVRFCGCRVWHSLRLPGWCG